MSQYVESAGLSPWEGEALAEPRMLLCNPRQARLGRSLALPESDLTIAKSWSIRNHVGGRAVKSTTSLIANDADNHREQPK
jgi:hypothetical protein